MILFIYSFFLQNNIQLLPAVTETQRACFQLWIIIVSIVGGLMLAFVLVVVLGLVSTARLPHPQPRPTLMLPLFTILFFLYLSFIHTYADSAVALVAVLIRRRRKMSYARNGRNFKTPMEVLVPGLSHLLLVWTHLLLLASLTISWNWSNYINPVDCTAWNL